MTEGMHIRMVGCTYSFEVWHNLEQYFASQTKAKINQLKTQLRMLKKGSLPITEYLLKIKKLVDSLSAVGAPMTVSDHIDAVLEGLPEEYNSFIVSVTSRTDPYTVNQIESLLVAQEDRIEKRKKDTPAPMSANPVAQSTPTPPKSPKPNSSSGFSQPRSFPNNNSGGRFGPSRGSFRGGRGRGGRSSFSNKPQCQVCGKYGHMAWQCYHRFNSQFVSPFSSNSSNYSHSPSTPSPQTPQAHFASSSSSPYFNFAWYPDSGATNHVTPNLNNLSSASVYTGGDNIQIADGSGIIINHVGSAKVHSTSSPSSSFLLKTLLHVPQSSKNLLSVSRFAHDNNVFFEFHSNCCFVKSQATRKVLLQGVVRDGLYIFDNLFIPPSLSSTTSSLPTSAGSALVASKASSSSLFDLWHCRLGHPSSMIVSHVLQQCNLPFSNKNTQSLCSACCLGKTHRLPFTTSFSPCSAPLEIIHSDVWGPAPITSINGYRYYVHFVDAFTRFTWIFLIKNKSDVAKLFPNFKQKVENQFNHKIKALHTDGGGEFVGLNPFLAQHGIIHRVSCPYTPAQNGIAERKNRHIVDIGLTLLAKASLPLKYWDHAFLTAIFLINKLPAQNLNFKSPYELIFHKPPDYTFLKTFGCACYPNLRPYNSTKLQFRSTLCTFLGYSSDHRGYKCLDSKGKIYISRDVLFDETSFPFVSNSSTVTSSSVLPPLLPTPSPFIPILPFPTHAPSLLLIHYYLHLMFYLKLFLHRFHHILLQGLLPFLTHYLHHVTLPVLLLLIHLPLLIAVLPVT